MEHGHHRQHAVPLGKAEGIPEAGAHRVQVAGPVTVDDPLRVPGGPAGVAHRRGRALVERWPVERVRLRGQQVLIAVHAHAGELIGPGRIGERAAGHDHVLDGGGMGQDLGEPGNQRSVHDDGLVLRVGGDVADLGRREPDVQRVQHRAHRGDRQVGLEMLGVVPHEGADPLVRVDAQSRQGVGQPGGPAARFGVSATSGPVPGPRDDFPITEYGRSVPHDRCDRQWEIHHRAPHRATSSGCLTCIPDSAMSRAPGSRSCGARLMRLISAGGSAARRSRNRPPPPAGRPGRRPDLGRDRPGHRDDHRAGRPAGRANLPLSRRL